MNKKFLKPVLIVVGSAFILTGCVVRERDTYHTNSAVVTSDVEVAGPPPPEVVEVQTASPGPDFVWVGGYYGWAGGAWRWNNGHWDRRPHPGAVWVRPRYVYRGGHHYWVRGGWR